MDRLASTEGEEGEEVDNGRACAFESDLLGVGLVKECPGSTVGLQKEGERLWSAILREWHLATGSWYMDVLGLQPG